MGSALRAFLKRHRDDWQPLADAGDRVAAGMVDCCNALLIEADDTVRKLTEKVLASAGFQVLESVNWPLAMRLVNEKRFSVDLILADVLGAEMPGREAADKILSAHPGARVLLTSGYSEERTPRTGMPGQSFDFICKPYNRQELLEKIGEILGKKD